MPDRTCISYRLNARATGWPSTGASGWPAKFRGEGGRDPLSPLEPPLILGQTVLEIYDCLTL